MKPPPYVDYGEHISIGVRTFVDYNLTAPDSGPRNADAIVRAVERITGATS